MHFKRLALAAFAVVCTAAAQPSGTGMLAGKVIQTTGGEPVRKAAVTLTWHGSPKSVALARTDGNGRFFFEGLPAGSYTLSAGRDGFGTGVFGGGGQRATGEFVKLAGGERRDGLVIRVSMPASISGTVYDDEGDPVQGANVQLMLEAYPRGTRQVIQVSAAITNHKGEYQINSVRPGKYYVLLDSPGMGIGPAGEQVFRRQYYGGDADWKRATPVTVGSGQQIRGIDFRAATTHSVRVAGHVTGATASQPNAGSAGAPGSGSPEPVTFARQPVVNIQLHSLAQEFQGAEYATLAGPPKYTFEIAGVVPGSYRATAFLRQEDGRMLYSRQTIEVTEQPSDVELALEPPVDISGTLRYEGDAAVRPPEFQVELVPGELIGTMPLPPAKVRADGTFTVAAVPPGIWDINPGPIPNGGFIKSMRLGKQDVLTEEMEIGPAMHARLNIIISSRGGRVEGEIDDDARKRSAATIMLAPVGKFAAVMSFFTLTESDADGKFKFPGLTPGNYRLFAFDQQPEGDFRGPDIVEKMAALGTPVEVVEGEAKQIQVKLITPEQLDEVLR